MVPWALVLTSPMSIVSGVQSGNSKFSLGQETVCLVAQGLPRITNLPQAQNLGFADN